jgi:Thioredoxin-like
MMINLSLPMKAAAVLLMVFSGGLTMACKLPFEPTVELAQAKAEKRQCPVLLLFTGLDWSPRSITLDKRLLEHAVIEGLIERSFVPVLVDFPQRVKLSAELQRINLDLAERHGVAHFPTLIALTHEGREIGRLDYQEETVSSLTAILEGWANHQTVSPASINK